MKKLYYTLIILVLPFLGIAQTDMAKSPLQPERGPIIDNISADIGDNSNSDKIMSEAVKEGFSSGLGNVSGSQTDNGAQTGNSDGQVVVDDRSTRLIDEEISTLENINRNLRFYPNPAISSLNVKLGDEYDVTISLMNVLGQEVYSNKGLQQQVQISVSDFPRGTYFLTIQFQGEVIVKRIELTN